MLTVPVATPVTIPELLPTVAIVPSLVVHVPRPPVRLARVVVLPVHTEVTPDIEPGAAFTPKVATALHPV